MEDNSENSRSPKQLPEQLPEETPENISELQKAYAAQIERKDREIEELKKSNNLLMKTAMKQSEKAKEWEEVAKRILKKQED